MRDEFLSLLKLINVHIKADEEKFEVINNKKRDHLKDILLKQQNFQLIQYDQYGMIYSNFYLKSTNNCYPTILISSHIDTVFQERDYFVREEEENIWGTFDNSITNTAIAYLMLHHNFKTKNILISFTLGEEIGGVGAYKTVRWLEEKQIKPQWVITLDVTNDNFHVPISIENIFSNRLGYSQEKLYGELSNILNQSGIRAGFSDIDAAGEDESCYYGKYKDMKWDCFSFCLPVKGPIHSEKGCCTEKIKIMPYIEGLKELLERL